MMNFYDELAKRLGGYGFADDGLEYRSEYPTSDPEKEFFDAVIQLSGPEKTALDIGCGDGIFSFRVADRFQHIDGIDNSKELIKIAKQKQNELGLTTTHFIYGDASMMSFQNATFDVAFNRRGPSFYAEYARVLKPGGMYSEIGIGEQDARALKEVFGRGQDFENWTTRRIDRDMKLFAEGGFSIVRAEDYFYKELYPSRAMFETFLQGVPIFEDFDKQKDSELLDAYCSSHTTETGEVVLNRHRVVYVLRKNR